jgi:hypothetical protein
MRLRVLPELCIGDIELAETVARLLAVVNCRNSNESLCAQLFSSNG